MFDDIERRFLLQLARDCHSRGLSAEDSYKRIRAQIGAFTCDNRLRCAISHVFNPD